MNIDIVRTTEKKLICAFRYEQRVPADANKIRVACALTNAHARKLQRLIEQGAAISAESARILEFLRRTA